MFQRFDGHDNDLSSRDNVPNGFQGRFFEALTQEPGNELLRRGHHLSLDLH